MASPTPPTDPPPATPTLSPAADRLAWAIANAGKLGAGVLIFVDFFSAPAGIDPSTLAAAALLGAVAQGIEGSLAVVIDRVLTWLPSPPR
jgi:hypothetical protein